MKRQRGRGRKGNGQSNRSFESNGPDIKIRGSANHIYEKYLQLSRDASSSGDRVMSENYLQHAEHYYRIIQANQAQQKEREDARAQRDEAQDGPSSNGRGADAEADSGALDVVTPKGDQDGEFGGDQPDAGDAPPPKRARRSRRPRNANAEAGDAADAQAALEATRSGDDDVTPRDTASV